MSTERYQKGISIHWSEVHRDTRELARRVHNLNDGKPWKGLIAITRGGLVPAAIIARELNIRLIDTMCVASYSSASGDAAKDQGDLDVLKPVMAIEDQGQGWLIVDDLVDTGKTARKVREYLPNAHFCCIYAKPLGREVADTVIAEVDQDCWIYFPWDMEQQFIRPIREDE